MDDGRRTTRSRHGILWGTALLAIAAPWAGALATAPGGGAATDPHISSRVPPGGPAEAARYHFLPSSRLEVLTRSAGLLSFLGEDHRIRAGSFSGLVTHDPLAPTRSSVDVRVPVDSLEVLTPVDPADRAEIRRRMLDEVLRSPEHPAITFSSTSVEPVAGTLLVDGLLSIRGTPRHVVVGMTTQLRADTLLAQGRLSVRLSDYDIDPPGVAWGTIKVHNQVDLDLYVRALRADVADVVGGGEG